MSRSTMEIIHDGVRAIRCRHTFMVRKKDISKEGLLLAAIFGGGDCNKGWFSFPIMEHDEEIKG